MYNFPKFYFEVHSVHQKLQITKTDDTPIKTEDIIVGMLQVSIKQY